MAKKTFLERMVNIQKNRKDPVKTAKHRYIDYYDKLPINEKAVLLEGEFGTRLDGNIFYILRYLCSSPKYEEFEFYISSWKKYADGIQSKLDAYGLDKVNLLIYSSDEYVRMLASAKYLISDVTFPNYFIKKEGQVYLNTWHGTPLKAMGKSMSDDVMIGNVQKNLVESDYLLYPNAYTREHMLDDYMLKNISPGSYVMCGYPRNTIFFDTSRIDKIKSELGISDKRVYAYMPTWRGKTGSVGNAKSSAFMIYYLYELDKKRRPPELIKSVFELHLCAMLGFSPDLRACRICMRYEHERMFFDFEESCIVCGDCVTEYSHSSSELTPLTPSLLYAMRHMVFSPVDKIYKIEINGEDMKNLSEITEKYLLKQLDRGFRSLEYYYSVKPGKI